ncbi:MAG TPA: hypothetical protein VN451_02085 [Chitinophagaceae bacterium]|nr:hypothetical protein [Chitinophagaceae bacterium]
MNAQLSLSVIEIIVLMLGAITLGVTIHFFISSRRSFNATVLDITGGKTKAELTEWKLRYFNDTESRDKEILALKKRLAEAEENTNIFSIEAEEMRKLYKKTKAEVEGLRQTASVPDEKKGYVEQLRKAQESLLEHNNKISQLLNQIDIAVETEEKQHKLIGINEELSVQIEELKLQLLQKENEINSIRQKQELTTEMTSMIDSAYSEFNVLQQKIQKMENQVNASRKINLEYEDLREEHNRAATDLKEQKEKYSAVIDENKELQELLDEAESKLKEANFQRQQLQKKVAYLEELNNDMQTIADANKKLEGQMKRIGELESMLNVVSEERDELARRQMNV